MTIEQPHVHVFPLTPGSSSPGPPRALVILLAVASVVVGVAGMKAAAWIVSPVLLALVIVISIAPVHGWLRAHRLPGWAATLALVLAVYGVIVGFAVVMVVSLAQLATELPRYADRFDQMVTGAGDLFARYGIGGDQVRELARSVDFGKLLGFFGSLLSGMTGFVTNLVFLLALLLFLSVEAVGVDRRMAAIDADRPSAAAALRDFARKTRRYIVVTTIFGLIVAVLDTVALALLGVPLALLWGLLSFVTNYVPNIGFFLGLLPPALLALLSGGWRTLLVVIVLYVLFNMVVQSIIQPYYVGDAVGLPPVVTFLALVFWSWVLGPVGTILAIPVTLLVKSTLIDIDPGAGWLSALLHVYTGTPRRRRKPRGT